ncbi:MAG: hypothetical protein ABI668_00290 [Sphingorhabdus sp.]
MTGKLIASLWGERSPRRWAVLFFYALAAILFAYVAAINAAANITRRKNADLALSLVPSEPVALTLKADLKFLSSQSKASLSPVEALVKSSLRQQPLNATAVRLLGYVADLRGQPTVAQEYIRLATKISRREFGAQLWLIEAAAAKEDVPTALRHYDIALRSTEKSRAVLFPTLADALANPEVRRQLLPYLRQPSNWMWAFVSDTIDTNENPEYIAETLVAAGQLSIPDEYRSLPDRLLARLAAKSRYDTFRQYYRSLPGANLAIFTAAGLNATTVNLPYPIAGWQMNDGVATGGDFAKANDKQFVLNVFAGSGERGQIMQKLMFLAPGRYLFSARYHVSEMAPGADVRWDFKCLRTEGSDSLWFAASPLRQGNFAQAAKFIVPSDCPNQILQLQAAGGPGQNGVEFSVRYVAIQPR